jgi:predicted TPR repeat methyltransferase
MSASSDNTLVVTAIEEARKAYDAGDFAKARERCKQVVETNPESAHAVQLLGQIEYGDQKFGNAAKLFAEALVLDPQNIDLIVGLGSALVACGESERGFDAIARAGFTLDDRSASLYNKLGVALRSIEKLEEAGRAFRLGVEIDGQSVELHYNLGLTYEEQHRLDSAIAEYAKTIELDPKHVEALVGLGRVYEEQGKQQLAVNSYQGAIKLDPHTKEAHMNLGKLLVEEYLFDEAAVCYRNVLVIDPDEVAAYEGLGECYMNLNRLDESETHYKRACDLGSAHARHFLAAVKQVSTEIAPREYVKELFDNYAKDFDDHLKDTLSYRVPDLLYEAFTRACNAKERIRRAVDLGCGTGLAGIAFERLADHIHGVDLSPGMLEQADKRKIYSELHNADIVEYLNGCGVKYDLFIASDAFIYIGNLSPVLMAVRDAAARGAYLVFSVESTEKDGFLLQRSGRYAHSDGYIRKLASDIGFTILDMETAQLRTEEESWIQGKIIVAEYGQGA